MMFMPHTIKSWMITGKMSVFGAICLLAVLLMPTTLWAGDQAFARMETEQGEILLTFYPDLAPHHVGNFLHLARTGFFDGTCFHRIVPGFVIQGGDPNSKDDDPRNDGQGGPSIAEILTAEEYQLVEQVNQLLAAKGYLGVPGKANLKAEFSTSVKHLRGSLSMARSQDVNSAGSQFFICVDDTPALNGKYTVFGHVVKGIEVADAIVSAETNPAAGRESPLHPVHVSKITVLDGLEGLTPEEKAAWDELPAELKSVQ